MGVDYMNFVFISPHFPHTYWNFCDRLKNNGINVLGIGDAPYDSLENELKQCLTEYYRVNNMENYDEMYRALGYFAFKYGRIDWLESNNEYWLEQDSKLRSDFNIKTGIKNEDIYKWKSKANMKPFYRAAGVPVARLAKIPTLEAALDFMKEIDYPVIVKPDIGVGAADTYKISNEEGMRAFFASKIDVPYVCEEFITGNIYSYDAILDSNCNPVFESSSVFPPSVADIVNQQLDFSYYTLDKIPEQLAEYGRATAKAFGVQSRFVHFEFFRLTKARKGIGEVGDFAGLEVNMRPAGGYSPDMMNFAHAADVYQIYADMVAYDKRLFPDYGLDHYCVYASRRDIHQYVYSHQEVCQRYGKQMVMCERMPDVLSGAMGNQMYTIHAYSLDEVNEFIEYVQLQKGE